MTPTLSQEKLADRLAQLLAESPLDGSTKQQIIDRMDQLTEQQIFDLLDTLKVERDQMVNTATVLEIIGRQQDEDWAQVAARQQDAADQLTAKYIQEADEQERLKELKQKTQDS